jgi:putative transposase
MSRRRRWFFEGVPLHIHQRGNNRIPVFEDDYDRVVFLRRLLDATLKFEVAVHAWVLMRTHFHLLATPGSPDALSLTMQELGRRYVRPFNRRHQRTGTLWEGRYNAHLIESEIYWFRCMRYVELNPVRAAMVRAPEEHRWCSYHALGCGAPDALITPHRLYLALGASETERQLAYRRLCNDQLTSAELGSIRDALRTGRILGEQPEPSADLLSVQVGT